MGLRELYIQIKPYQIVAWNDENIVELEALENKGL